MKKISIILTTFLIGFIFFISNNNIHADQINNTRLIINLTTKINEFNRANYGKTNKKSINDQYKKIENEINTQKNLTKEQNKILKTELNNDHKSILNKKQKKTEKSKFNISFNYIINKIIKLSPFIITIISFIPLIFNWFTFDKGIMDLIDYKTKNNTILLTSAILIIILCSYIYFYLEMNLKLNITSKTNVLISSLIMSTLSVISFLTFYFNYCPKFKLKPIYRNGYDYDFSFTNREWALNYVYDKKLHFVTKNYFDNDNSDVYYTYIIPVDKFYSSGLLLAHDELILENKAKKHIIPVTICLFCFLLPFIILFSFQFGIYIFYIYFIVFFIALAIMVIFNIRKYLKNKITNNF